MKTSYDHNTASFIGLALTIGVAALPEVGCVDGAQPGEGTQDNPATAEVGRDRNDEDVARPNVLATSWRVPFISVDHSRDAAGKRKVLDIPLNDPTNGRVPQLWEQNGKPQQAWTVTRDASDPNSYELRNEGTGKCLEMGSDILPPFLGELPEQWTCNGASNQRWLASAGSGWVVLHNSRFRDYCLDLTNADFSNGVLIQVWTPCDGTWNQRWNIFP